MTDWAQPLVSVDVVAVRHDGGVLSYATGKRQFDPFAGRAALPGVLLATGESLAEAAARAVASKLDLPAETIRYVAQFGAFDGTNRDPRGATISIGHLCAMTSTDGSATWVPIDVDPQGLPFDHDAIVAAAVAEVALRLWADMVFTRAIIGPTFTSGEALAVTRQVGGRLPAAEKNIARWLRDNDHAESIGMKGRDSVWCWQEP